MSGYQDYLTALQFLAPELVLTVGILFAALWNLFAPKATGVTPIVSLLSLIGCGYLLGTQFGVSQKICSGVLTIDPLYLTFSGLAIFVGVLSY